MQLDIGNNFQIRSFQSEDVDAIVKYANNRKIWLNLRDLFPHPYTKIDGINWIKQVQEEKPERNFAIASNEEVIGGIGITLQSDVNRLSGEIGYWLGEPFWGRDITSRAVKAFTEYAFVTYNIIRIYAYIFSNNLASMRVLEKAGYTCEGCLRGSIIKDGKICDSFVYSILRRGEVIL